MPARQSPLIPFGEWTPDMLATFSKGASVAMNCRTLGDDYVPFQSFGAVSAGLPSRCMGAFACKDSTGAVHHFAGTMSGLYKLAGTGWQDVTHSAGAYQTSQEGWWSFVNFGQLVLATNFSDFVQVFNLTTSSEFEDLTAAPKCHGLVVISNFVVAFGVEGFHQRVQWCALNNPYDWTPSLATQADFNDILGDGQSLQWVTGSQNTGTAVMEKEIHRMTYVGSPLVFQFDKVEGQTGTPAPLSVCVAGELTFYLGENGLKMFDGTRSHPIGDRKVDKYFYQRVDRNYLKSRVMAVADPAGNTVIFAYPSVTDSNDGTITHLLVCHIVNRYRFTEVRQDISLLMNGITIGVTLDDLTDMYGTLDNVPFSLGSSVWQGGTYLLSGFDSQGRLGYFDGLPMDAVLETSEIQLNPGGFAIPDSVGVITDAEDVAVEIGYRNMPKDVVAYTAPQAPQPETGECNFEVGSKYARARVTLQGEWTMARGVQVRAVAGGGI